MMNRALILIMIAAMWQSTLSYSQRITIDSIKTCSGSDTVLVPVNVTDFNNIGAITLYIVFDATVLKFDSVTNINPTLPGTIANKIPNKPQIGIVWSATNAGVDVVGKFFDLRFIIKKIGISTLSFDAASEIADFNADVINVSYTNGSVEVNPLPNVSFTGLTDNYCLSSLSDTLTGIPAGGQFSGAGISNNIFNAPLAGIGTHTIIYTYTSDKGCSNSAVASVTVNQNPAILITPINSAICNGDSVMLTASGATTYLWNTGETTASVVVSPVSTTIYFVTGTGANGCSNTQSVEVIVNQNPVVTITSSSSTICSGESVILTASGAAIYLWSNGETTASIVVSPDSTATYMVSGTLGGCTNTQTTVMTVNLNPTISIIPSNPTICNGESVTLIAQGASAYYLWNDGQTTSSIIVSPIATTTYSVTGTLGTCSTTQTTTVIVNANPVITIIPANPSICKGSLVTLTAQGASTYLWSNGDSTASIVVSPDSTTTYTVTGTLGSCSGTQTSVVTVNANPVITITPANSSICNGSSVTLTADGGTTYLWNNGESTASIIVTPTSTTIYTVTGTSENSCQDTAVTTVVVNPNPTINISSSNPSICTGDSVTLSANGAFMYLWNNGETTSSIIVAPTSTTTYTVTGTLGVCSATQTTMVTVNPNPIVSIIPDNPTICNGGTVTLTANGASGYTWSSGASTQSIIVSPSVTTTYTVTGANESGCTATQSVQVSVNQNLIITITPSNPIICSGELVTLTANGASAYLWSSGHTSSSIVISPSVTTTYTVIGKNGDCTSAKSVQVIVNPNPVITIIPDSPKICKGGSVTLTASGALAYFWSNGQTTSSIIVSLPATTAYTVTGTNANGCQSIATTTVIVSSSVVTVDAGANKNVYVGYTPLSCTTIAATGIGGGTPGYSLLWSSGATTSSIVVCPVINTKYSVTVTDAKGCKAKDSVLVCAKDVRCQTNKVKVCGTFTLFGNVIGRQTYCLSEATATILLSLNSTFTTWKLGACGMSTACDFGLGGKTELTEGDFGQERLTAKEYALIYGSSSVKLYPNPSSNSSFVNIEMINVPDKTVQVTVTNIIGQVLLNEKITVNDYYVNKQLNFDFILTSGTYIVSVITEETVITEKLIIR